MPIPSPTPEEKKNKDGKQKFLARCFHALRDEKKPQAQKAAICLATWERAKKRKRAKGSNEPPTWEDDVQMNGFFIT